MIKYCIKCNFGNLVSDTPIKFCQNCGEPFGGTIATQIKPIQVVRPIKRAVAKQIEEEYEEILPDEEYDNTSHHHDFKVEFEYTKPKREKETLKNLAFDRSEKLSIQRPKEKDIKNKKKFLENWEQDFNKGTRKNSSELGG